MSISTDALISEALQLSPHERARIAAELISSLDEPGESHLEVVWQAEIAKRLEEVDSGDVTLLSWEQERQSLRECLNDARR